MAQSESAFFTIKFAVERRYVVPKRDPRIEGSEIMRILLKCV